MPVTERHRDPATNPRTTDIRPLTGRLNAGHVCGTRTHTHTNAGGRPEPGPEPGPVGVCASDEKLLPDGEHSEHIAADGGRRGACTQQAEQELVGRCDYRPRGERHPGLVPGVIYEAVQGRQWRRRPPQGSPEGRTTAGRRPE